MDITLDDFIQKYRGTFVFLKTNQGNILTEFVEADQFLSFYEPSLGNIQVTFDNARNTIVTKFPTTGIYNIGEKLFAEVFRNPERQFKACPCNTNTRIIEVYTGRDLPVDFTSISESFSPWFPRNKTIAVNTCDERGGVALNRKFGITLSNKADFDLFYKTNKIGTIKDSKVSVDYQPLLQETKDFFGDDLVWKT